MTLTQNHEKNSIIKLQASLTKNGPILRNGIVWRIFSISKTSMDQEWPLVASSTKAVYTFSLPEGEYLIHAAFGQVSRTKHLMLGKGKQSEIIILNAGGIQLKAALPKGVINKSQLKFSIYSDDTENNEHGLILSKIKPDKIVRLNSGTYHVVSHYGDGNAIVRSDLQVEAGKITEATMQHRAGEVTLKLVRQKGREALADTSWAITNESGDIVYETTNAYAYMILAEGDYFAVAKNKNQIYQKHFSISSGNKKEIEILSNT
ncbi:MAG: hypothetical protein JSC161_000761 [Candidatus Tokpelaia sp. JSC161]|jgi:hypothetical protein|nr:MAG: hypothetical protein JSC161_000761 [Candidatus Tokpelaia sp. JSC161]